MEAFTKIIGIGVLFVVMVVAFSALFSLPVWLLWNWLMPAIFGLTKITWLQAWGLMLLCGFLFKSSSVTTTTTKN